MGTVGTVRTVPALGPGPELPGPGGGVCLDMA